MNEKPDALNTWYASRGTIEGLFNGFKSPCNFPQIDSQRVLPLVRASRFDNGVN
jgi:hypothetical protein